MKIEYNLLLNPCFVASLLLTTSYSIYNSALHILLYNVFNHIYTALCDVPLLKQAAIYGSYGAGKSNIVKALEFLRAFALAKDFTKNIELEKFFYP